MTILVPPRRLADVVTRFDGAVLITLPERGGDGADGPGFVKIHVVDPVVVSASVDRGTGKAVSSGDAEDEEDVEDAVELVIADPRASALRNVEADPHVTVVWRPSEHHGWTLIVDGRGRVAVDPSTGSPVLRIAVGREGGMLHRPRAHADGPDWVW